MNREMIVDVGFRLRVEDHMSGGTMASAAKGRARTLRIFHGPKNIAGIGRYLADWQREHGAVSDFIVYQDDTWRQNHHFSLHLERKGPLSRAWTMFRFFLAALKNYDLFHFYFGETLLPVGLKWPLPFSPDLPVLKLLGKTIVMTYCGDDIRLHEIERKRNPYAALFERSSYGPEFDRRKRRRMWWQSLFVDRFIAVRNLYAHATAVIPERKIVRDIEVNTTVDISAYKPEEYVTRDVPVLVHAPSSPKFKGTEFVEKAIDKLRAEGYKFEYKKLHGVPGVEAHRIYREESDVIVDQVLGGGFGALAIEGMYYGKPVCGYLLDVVYEWYPDCPIVNVNLENLRTKLAWLIENPEERIRLGKEGRAFVEAHFSREEINRRLWELYGKLRGGSAWREGRIGAKGRGPGSGAIG